MNLTALNLIASAAATPLAERAVEAVQGSEQTAQHQRKLAAAAYSERALEGEMTQQEGASDRDADGRRLWEKQAERRRPDDDPQKTNRDASGLKGKQLDLQG